MRGKVLFLAAGVTVVLLLAAAGSASAYYYPSAGHVPPGPPPNYNQVDTSYFLGTPVLPLPPPDDSGGMYVYYDQGIWNIANHIYSRGGSYEQFHCCVLAEMSQPPTLGVNVFIEKFEFWGDTTTEYCLKQNDRWGWIPWGDNLYEIWWDVTTKEWIDGQGDPNDFVSFRIAGCAVDFNLWSSGHGCFFGETQIFLGADKTRLSDVPGFWDTFAGWSDPYQSQAGVNPTADPNITIFTLKSDAPRSYNKLGLINPTDSYTCDLALQYGQRYAGTFAYEGNGIQFSVYVSPRTGEFECPEDDTVHAGTYYISTDFTLTHPDCDPSSVEILDISPSPSSHPDTLPFVKDSHVEWQTNCSVGDYVITLITNEQCSVQDTCSFTVTMYNNHPDLTCPLDGNVEQGQTFVSNDFSATDVDNDPVTVTFLDISPSATNDPQVVDDHVEWTTTGADALGKYTIRLIAKDHCGLSDICQFTVTVDKPTSVFECPEDDSVHADHYFVSTNFTLTHAGCDPSAVEVLDVDRPVTHMPFISSYHVEWQTTCDEDGDYVITLVTGAECPTPDTCSFTVTVYNRPPELICPDYGQVRPLGLFVSTDFYASDPFGEQVEVYLLDIEPDPYLFDENGDSVPSPHQPEIKASHVEWKTECIQNDFVITLVATDPCGLADTCEFWVSVYFEPKPDFYIWVNPITQYVRAGYSVGYLVELNSNNSGFANPCSLNVCWLPNPPNMGDFDQPVITPTDFTTLNVHTTSATDTGTYTLIVTGKEIAGMCTHSTPVYVKVGEPLDIAEEADDLSVPEGFALFQSYPNPFNPEARISYYLPRDCQVTVTIYNVLGQRVRTLFDGRQGAGTHTSIWDGRDDAGLQSSSGIYFYRMQADRFVETKKMTLIK